MTDAPETMEEIAAERENCRHAIAHFERRLDDLRSMEIMLTRAEMIEARTRADVRKVLIETIGAKR